MIYTTTKMILYVTNGNKYEKGGEWIDGDQAADSDRSREYIALQ